MITITTTTTTMITTMMMMIMMNSYCTHVLMILLSGVFDVGLMQRRKDPDEGGKK